jgi:hypothetical protein
MPAGHSCARATSSTAAATSCGASGADEERLTKANARAKIEQIAKSPNGLCTPPQAHRAAPRKIDRAPHPLGPLARRPGMDPKPLATTKASTFRAECAVRCTIAASPGRIWSLLTNASEIPRWTSTVTSIGGEIAKGNRLALRVPTSERTFTPTVTELEPEARMVWTDGFAPMFKGERTFTLLTREDGTTEFTMVEVFSGVMLPMIKGTLPDFAPVFEAYASDLKREAEREKAS